MIPCRLGSDKGIEDTFIQSVFTHHQKSVIVDAPPEEGSERRLVAYIGGLDLTNGRFDTPDHELYKNLTTWHVEDFQ